MLSRLDRTCVGAAFCCLYSNVDAFNNPLFSVQISAYEYTYYASKIAVSDSHVSEQIIASVIVYT